MMSFSHYNKNTHNSFLRHKWQFERPSNSDPQSNVGFGMKNDNKDKRKEQLKIVIAVKIDETNTQKQFKSQGQ